MPNGMYGGVRGEETKVGQKTFVSRPTRFYPYLNRPITPDITLHQEVKEVATLTLHNSLK